MGVPQNRERFFLLSQRKDVAIPHKWPKPMPLDIRLEDVLEEEVADRYFLKDDAVSKFLEANDEDNALFMQFDLPPTHEAAMFLKTLLHMEMKYWGEYWSKSVTECKKHMKRLSVTRMYEEFKKDSGWMDKIHYGFYEEFKENMERKKDEN